MRLIAFEDKCVIKRRLGTNEYDEPIMESVYSGVCCYQEGCYSNAQRMFVRNPILFLPDVSVLVDANDVVEVATAVCIQDVPQCHHIVLFGDERSSHKVNIILNTEENIGFVLL